MSAAGSRAAGWAAHLRGGGTTPWAEWADPGGDVGPLPGAQQLELLRRLNLVDGPVPERLVERVWTANAVGRGLPDLPLPDGPEPRFGARPADPSTLPADELLRVAVGLLAHDLAHGPVPADDPADTRAGRVVRRLARRRYRLVGDPLAVASLGAGLAASGRHPSARPDRVVVLTGPLARTLGHAWSHACLTTDVRAWPAWLGRWSRNDQVPPWLDAPALAAEWSARIGARRVHVVGDLATASRLLRGPGVLEAPTATSADLARRLQPALSLLVTPEQRRRLVQRRWWQLGEVARGLPELALPARQVPWVARQDDRLRARLAAGAARAGYAVHGEPLAPTPVGEGVSPTPESALDLALRCLIDGRLRKAA